MMYFKNKNKENKGFSLVEVLVATSILLITIVGPMGLVNRINNTDRFSNENATATFLAQEGVELSQAARDYRMLMFFDNVFNDGGSTDPANCNMAVLCPWRSFLAVNLEPGRPTNSPFVNCVVGGPNGSNGCSIDIRGTSAPGPHTLTVAACGANGAGCEMYERNSFNNGNRTMYSHSSGASSLSPFTRVIRFHPTYSTGANPKLISLRVESTVTWRTGSLVSSQEVKANSYLFNVYDTR